MLTQLQMPIPLDTPKGKAWAVAIIDYGPHWDLLWVTFLSVSGQCWTFNNKDIRQEENYTFGFAAPAIPGLNHENTNGITARNVNGAQLHHTEVMETHKR